MSRGARPPKTVYVFNGYRYVQDNLDENRLERSHQRILRDLSKEHPPDVVDWVDRYMKLEVGRDPEPGSQRALRFKQFDGVPVKQRGFGPIVESGWMGSGNVQSDDPRRNAAADACEDEAGLRRKGAFS